MTALFYTRGKRARQNKEDRTVSIENDFLFHLSRSVLMLKMFPWPIKVAKTHDKLSFIKNCHLKAKSIQAKDAL